MDDVAGRPLPDQEAYRSRLLDQMDVAVIATDTDLVITAWNRAAEELYGWPAQQVIGRPVREVVGPFFRAGEREAILDRLGQNRSVRFDRGEPARPPVLQHHRSGRTLIIEGNAAPVLAPDGALIGYVAAVHDVTGQAKLAAELAESEAKYRNLVELSPDAILIHQDGAIVFANAAAAALVGEDGPGDLVGRSILEIVHPGARKDVEWNIWTDLRGEESPITTVEVVRRDGSTVMVQGRGSRIPLGGRPAVQVVLRDVTGQLRAVTGTEG